MRRREARAWHFRGESGAGRGGARGEGRAWSGSPAAAGGSGARPPPTRPPLLSPPRPLRALGAPEAAVRFGL